MQNTSSMTLFRDVPLISTHTRRRKSLNWCHLFRSSEFTVSIRCLRSTPSHLPYSLPRNSLRRYYLPDLPGPSEVATHPSHGVFGLVSPETSVYDRSSRPRPRPRPPLTLLLNLDSEIPPYPQRVTHPVGSNLNHLFLGVFYCLVMELLLTRRYASE